MWYKTCLQVLCVIVIIVYSIGIGVFECYIGGRSSILVSKYYDYSVPINGTSIAIDALPRDVYKNTKDVAGVYTIFGAAGLFFCLYFFGLLIYNKLAAEVSKMHFISVVTGANASVIILPFCYSAFITWKLHSLSDSDINTWDTVNPEFIQLFKYSEKLMIATVVPGCLWVIAACFLIVTGECE